MIQSRAHGVIDDSRDFSPFPFSSLSSLSSLILLSRFLVKCLHTFSSKTSSFYVNAARKATLDFFDAPEDEYTVVFTSSTTQGLKLIGESYPFTEKNKLLIPIDAHNSVHGLRCFAYKGESEVVYLDSTKWGGVDIRSAKVCLHPFLPLNMERVTDIRSAQEVLAAKRSKDLSSSNAPPSLVVLTGLSNITNSKTPLTLASYAKSLGYNVVLDAAALAPTSKISLRSVISKLEPGKDREGDGEGAIDAMAISFYKMFGYPTGVGALIVKKSFLEFLSGDSVSGSGSERNEVNSADASEFRSKKMGLRGKKLRREVKGKVVGRKVWFAGGTVDVVQVPGKAYTLSPVLHERFEVRSSLLSSLIPHVLPLLPSPTFIHS